MRLRRWSGTNDWINVLDDVRKVAWASDINPIKIMAKNSQWEKANKTTVVDAKRIAAKQISPRL